MTTPTPGTLYRPTRPGSRARVRTVIAANVAFWRRGSRFTDGVWFREGENERVCRLGGWNVFVRRHAAVCEPAQGEDGACDGRGGRG